MFEIPVFSPFPLLSGGHRQTLAGYFFRSAGPGSSRRQHLIELSDGDQLVLHDDCPHIWNPTGPAALLMHGLAGCHRSAYMVRVAEKLQAHGIRTFRLDHRGCGAGELRARHPYHAGRSDDVLAAITRINSICPNSLVAAVGFSLSGNMLLKSLGEAESRCRLPQELACAVAVNPPIDLELCSRALARPINRIYERHFVKLLCQQVAQRITHFADAPRPTYQRDPTRLRVFDDQYTAHVSGFRGVKEYYERCSAAQFIPTIEVPTLIVTSRDDPLVPVNSFELIARSPAVAVHIAACGGHLGYIGVRNGDPDRRWLDWRIVDWLCAWLRP